MSLTKLSVTIPINCIIINSSQWVNYATKVWSYLKERKETNVVKNLVYHV